MEQNNRNENNKNNQKSAGKNVSAHSGLFKLTTQQLSKDISRYHEAIASNNSTVLNSQANLLKNAQSEVFKKRLNSMDSTMLEEVAYQILDNEELKLEKKIEILEKDLQDINEKLIVAKAIQDNNKFVELTKQKSILKHNIEALKKEYKQASSDTMITSVVTKALSIPSKLRKKIKKSLMDFLRHSKVLKKITPLFRALLVRDTIGKLNKINKSIDELVNMKIPFGEQESRYKTLVKHLSTAGALHAQILKEFNS